MHLSAGLPRPGTWWDLRIVRRVRKKTLHRLISAGNAALSRFRHYRPRGIRSDCLSSWMLLRCRHVDAKIWRQWMGAPGKYTETGLSLARLFSWLRPGPVVGKQLLRTICSIFSASLTLKEKSPRWCTNHLAPAWAMRATTRVWRGPRARNGTRLSLFRKGFVTKLKLAMEENGKDPGYGRGVPFWALNFSG